MKTLTEALDDPHTRARGMVWTAPDGRYSIGLHGKNILDKQYKTSGYQFLNINPVTGQPILSAAPRLPDGVTPNPAFGVPGIGSALGTEGVVTAFYGNPRQVFITGTVKF